MSRKCDVKDCASDSSRPEDKGVTYHKVPGPENIRNKWFQLCCITGEKRTHKVVYVCSRHFFRADFCNLRGRKYVLKQGVLPSVFPWDKSKLQAIKAKVKKEKKPAEGKQRKQQKVKGEKVPSAVASSDDNPEDDRKSEVSLVIDEKAAEENENNEKQVVEEEIIEENVYFTSIWAKSLNNITVAEKVAKRKVMSPANEQLLKLPEVEPNPKIQTALFKDNSIPTKTFYPKPSGPSGLYGAENQRKSVSRKSLTIKRSNKRTIRRNTRNRSQLGSINASVRHKIRRPKVNLLDREFRLHAALNKLENSPLNDHLYDEKLSRESQKQIMPASDTDSNKENVASGPSRKIDHSPSPDPTKNFFKHSHSKATVTMSKTVKLVLDHGRLSLFSKYKPKVCLDASNLLTGDSPEKVVDVDSIRNTLDTTITLNASHSVTASDNSIVLHAPTSKRTKDIKKPETMLSPTSVMCNMFSGLALNSPKKAKDLTAVLENLPAANSEKLYPIFESSSPKGGCKAKDDIPPVKSVSKVLKTLPKGQMLLDVDQKRFGYTHCAKCDTFYHMGDPGDELMHFNYHNALHVFKFPGWKAERVVRTIPPDGRIIQTHTSCKRRLRRILEILDYVNRELGFILPGQELDATVFLYIKKRTIVGFMMAQKYTTACKVLSTEGNLCSRETYPIQCTVSHIWVSPNHRQKGIGSALVDALKSSFMPGQQLSNADIAFSSPTEAGHKFCQKYFKTVNYLVTM